MKSVEVLSPGEKIRNIRKKFKIKQQDITGGEITRNLISIIENNKANLTENVAKILANNINEYCNKSSIDFKITSEYLLENINSQVDKICDNYIEFIDTIDADQIDTIEYSFDEVEIFMKKYNCREKKIIIFAKIGDKFKAVNQYDKAYYFYNKAYENYIMEDNKAEFFNVICNLIICCMEIDRYNQALNLINFAKYQFLELEDDKIYDLERKKIICYVKSGKTNYVLESIKNIEERYEEYLKTNLSEYISLLKIKSFCLKEKKYFLESLDIEKYILKIKLNTDVYTQFKSTSDIVEIYSSLRDRKNLQKYLNKLIKLQDEFDAPKELKPRVYFNIAIAYKAIGNINKAIEYLEKSKEIAIYIEDVEFVEKSILNLLNIYIEKEKKEDINNIKNIILQLVSKEKMKKNNSILFRLVKYYADIDDNQTIKDIIDFLI